MKVVGDIEGIVVRPLRRPRRRAPQARAADRQGLRSVLERRTGGAPTVACDPERARRPRSRRRGCSSTRQRRAASPRRRAWRAGSTRVAPARARGIVSIALVSDARDPRAEPPLPPGQSRDRRPEFPGSGGPQGRPTASLKAALRHDPRRHRDRARRRPAPGARARATRSRPSCACWRCTACCTCSATITSGTTGRMARVERRLRRKGGLREGLIERAAPMIPLDRSSCSACAARAISARIEAAFSALMRLSLRLAAERSDRPDALGAYLDDPLLLFVPVRLLLGLVDRRGDGAVCRRASASTARSAVTLIVVGVAAFVVVFELLLPVADRRPRSRARARTAAAVVHARRARARADHALDRAPDGHARRAGATLSPADRTRPSRTASDVGRARTSTRRGAKAASTARSGGCCRASWTSATRWCAK